MGVGEILQGSEVELLELALGGSVAVAEPVKRRVDVAVYVFVGVDVGFDLAHAFACCLERLRDAEIPAEGNHQRLCLFAADFPLEIVQEIDALLF